LAERPENVSLTGSSVKSVLVDTFGGYDQIPGLVRLLSGHLQKVVRQSNVIAIYNEHFFKKIGLATLLKSRRHQVRSSERKRQAILKNIAGLVCVEHGIELPLESIRSIAKIGITVRLGLLRPVKSVDILA